MTTENKTAVAEVDSSDLFAFVVTADNAEASVLTFAENRGKARAMAMRTNWFWDFEWTELKVRREPKADKWAEDKPEVLDGSGLRSAKIMHSLGWWCIDAPSCEWCGAGEWGGVPESMVAEREDFDHQEICEGCYKHELSKANTAMQFLNGHLWIAAGQKFHSMRAPLALPKYSESMKHTLSMCKGGPLHGQFVYLTSAAKIVQSTDHEGPATFAYTRHPQDFRILICIARAPGHAVKFSPHQLEQAMKRGKLNGKPYCSAAPEPRSTNLIGGN